MKIFHLNVILRVKEMIIYILRTEAFSLSINQMTVKLSYCLSTDGFECICKQINFEIIANKLPYLY